MKVDPEVAKNYPLLAEWGTGLTDLNRKNNFWEGLIMEDVSIVHAEKNKLVWEFDVKEKYCNMIRIIHGGCVATVIDLCSGISIMVHEGANKWKFVGVSLELQVNYFASMKAGQIARIECEVQKVSKNVATIYTRVYNKETNELCYTSNHFKHRSDSLL